MQNKFVIDLRQGKNIYPTPTFNSQVLYLRNAENLRAQSVRYFVDSSNKLNFLTFSVKIIGVSVMDMHFDEILFSQKAFSKVGGRLRALSMNLVKRFAFK